MSKLKNFTLAACAILCVVATLAQTGTTTWPSILNSTLKDYTEKIAGSTFIGGICGDWPTMRVEQSKAECDGMKLIYVDSTGTLRWVPPPRVFDSLRVLLLCCDTFPLGKYLDLDEGVQRLGTYSAKDGKTYYLTQCFWQFGYLVRERLPADLVYIPVEGGAIRPGDSYYYLPMGYLDEKKLPLSKNIVVWDAKEIK